MQQVAVVPVQVSQQAPGNTPQPPAQVTTATGPVATATGGAAGYQPPVIEERAADDTTVVHVHKARRDGEMSDEEPLIEA